jgi:hypothetical protein
MPKAKREKNDAYFTPQWLTEALFNQWNFLAHKCSTVLEPAAGGGAITEVVRRHHPLATIDEIDIDPQRAGIAKCNALNFRPEKKYSLVICNPPYSLAEEFCRRALEEWVAKNGTVAMLLRLSFLGSQKRARWLRDNTPSIYVTPRRPSFVRGGNDNCEYAWFVWDNRQPSVNILETDK